MTSPLGFKARVGSALFAIFAEANVMYIPQDSPLVLHLPTSWRPVFFFYLIFFLFTRTILIIVMSDNLS